MPFPPLETMTSITEEQLHIGFYEILFAAEAGEYFLITCTEGAQLVLMPYSGFLPLLQQADPAK
jgi:hypothetical protein